MEVQNDFRELFVLLNRHKVEYMIVGGYALAFHGAPRYTGDIDLFVNPDRDNARKILSALAEFGFGGLNLQEADFSTPDRVVQLGVPPVRIDFVTSVTGVPWASAVVNRIEGEYGDIPVYYIGREDFIRNKRSTGRIKDITDVEALGGDANP
ncbi:MAG: nucleotidyltransferase [Chitinispirillaceae bacterium]|nr:nucleotidyltransferase [Chitinispirillaceae bacterium]